MTSRAIDSVTYSLTYDAANRMTDYEGGSIDATFVYDGDGRRVKGTVNNVTTVYVGSYYEVQGMQRIAVREMVKEPGFKQRIPRR